MVGRRLGNGGVIVARMKAGAVGTGAAVDKWLDSRLVRVMATYSVHAGRPSPVSRAVEAVNRGEAVTVPGHWVGPDYDGRRVRLALGEPVAVVA